jgi:hypothetical protein
MYACAALVCPVHRALARDRISAPCLWRRVPRRCMLELRPVVSCHAHGCYRFTSLLLCFCARTAGQSSYWSDFQVIRAEDISEKLELQEERQPQVLLARHHVRLRCIGGPDRHRLGGTNNPAGVARGLPCLRGSVTRRPLGNHCSRCGVVAPLFKGQHYSASPWGSLISSARASSGEASVMHCPCRLKRTRLRQVEPFGARRRGKGKCNALPRPRLEHARPRCKPTMKNMTCEL